MVAPARERGLKFYDAQQLGGCQSRSREGAWIEIPALPQQRPMLRVAPARERGLKLAKARKAVQDIVGRSREGAWIEIRVVL